MHVDMVRITLPLKNKFNVSKGAAEAKTNVITILNNRYNGEASGSVQYGPSLEVIEADIKAGISRLKQKRKLSVKTLHEIGTYDIHPVARSALVGMVLNYISGESNRYPWEILSLSTPVGIKSSLTVSIDTPEKMIAAIRDSTHPILKVKMGCQDDMKVIDAIKDIAGKEIRIDANGAWSCEQAEEIIFYLAKQGTTVIEQPTDVEFIKDWPLLKGKNENVELILDEGLGTLEDFKRFGEYVDGINIKMEKCGGILEAIEVAKAAHKNKKKVMLGCMVESSVGIAQSVYMSSMADYYDLDAPQLLEDDIALGISYNRETIEVDREIIGGPKLKRDVVERYSED